MSFFTKSIGRNIIKAVEKDGKETRKEIGGKLDTLSDKLDTLVTILDERLPKKTSGT